jgi:hypothetical protein
MRAPIPTMRTDVGLILQQAATNRPVIKNPDPPLPSKLFVELSTLISHREILSLRLGHIWKHIPLEGDQKASIWGKKSIQMQIWRNRMCSNIRSCRA